MISRAASRTSSEAPAPFSVPSITAFSFSRVRSDAGILSIGVLLSQRPAQYRSSLIANQARVHPNPFPSKLRTSPSYRGRQHQSLCQRNPNNRRCSFRNRAELQCVCCKFTERKYRSQNDFCHWRIYRLRTDLFTCWHADFCRTCPQTVRDNRRSGGQERLHTIIPRKTRREINDPVACRRNG